MKRRVGSKGRQTNGSTFWANISYLMVMTLYIGNIGCMIVVVRSVENTFKP